jgi:hypothetical protein
MNRIQDIIEEIKNLEKELLAEMQSKEDEFFYKIRGRRIFFEKEARVYQKTFAINAYKYILNASLLNIITVPIIWSCLAPAFLLDILVSFYQFICFKIYRIPEVKRSKYIIIDRRNLAYLNIVEKINCFYCEYFNGLILYVQEIAARTEQYWCPIKHARKLAAMHSRYHKFLEYGDCQDYQKKLDELRKDFNDLTDGE